MAAVAAAVAATAAGDSSAVAGGAKATSERGFAETKDFRIATLGNVDSGKSTLVGCLTRGLLDDGRGKARSYVLRHQHEQKRGQSSAVTMTLMGYKAGEQVLPGNPADAKPGRGSHNKDFFEVASKATHRLQLVDLCGHQKYLKSSIYGLTAMSPDAALVVVGAERGIQRMTREHVGLACALRIPFFIVMTKVDMAPPDVLKESQMRLKRLLKRAGRKAYMVREKADLEGAIRCMEANQTAFAPIIEVSCVTGQNMDNLRAFVRLLTTTKTETAISHSEEKHSDEEGGAAGDEPPSARRGGASEADPVITPLEGGAQANTSGAADAAEVVPLKISLDDTYTPPGVGIVIGGTINKGHVHVGQKLFVGPTKLGEWFPVAVRSIHRQCVPSRNAYTGQHATFAIKSLTKTALKRDNFRKGMVAVDEHSLAEAQRFTVREFEADIKVLHHSTTIDRGYSPFIHLAGIRQSARIVEIRSAVGEEVVARTGSQVFVRFRFLHQPEFVEVGRPMIFREGNAKGCGRITRIFDESGDAVASEADAGNA